MSDDLKPCPFCGGKADATSYVIEASVICQTCKATITREHGQHDDNGLPEAIAAWNTRADDADVLRLRAALEKIGKTYQCDGNRLIHGPHEIINIVQDALERNKAKP